MALMITSNIHAYTTFESSISGRLTKLFIFLQHFFLFPPSRANVSYGQILRRRLSYVRPRGDCVRRTRPRRPTRSAYLRVPSDDQVYVPQIRNVGRGGKTRRSLFTPAQYRQREGLHISMVLVHHARFSEYTCHRLPGYHHHQSQNAGLSIVHQISPYPAGSDQYYREKELCRRLVSLLHVR